MYVFSLEKKIRQIGQSARGGFQSVKLVFVEGICTRFGIVGHDVVTFLIGYTAFPFSHGGAAGKGQSVRNWQSEPAGIKPSLPLPAIEKGKTGGMQDKKMPLGVFGLSGSSDTLWAAYLPDWFQLLTAVRPIEDDRRIIALYAYRCQAFCHTNALNFGGGFGNNRVTPYFD